MEQALEQSILIMTERVVDILKVNRPSVYLHGSYAYGDFRLGWSDIDILCLAGDVISSAQANTLVSLRQTLTDEHPENPYFRLFEGGFLTLCAFLEKIPDTVVYWGTSGQRITDFHSFNSFDMAGVLERGILLFGEDVRGAFAPPTLEELRRDVIRHYETIRKHAQKTDGRVYSAGWLLDIARCLYTLETGRVASKTEAGEWALQNGLCPVPVALERAAALRKNPAERMRDEGMQAWLSNLGGDIQAFADVLEAKLSEA